MPLDISHNELEKLVTDRYGYYHPFTWSDAEDLVAEAKGRKLLFTLYYGAHVIHGDGEMFCYWKQNIEEKKPYLSIARKADRDILLHPCASFFIDGVSVTVTGIVDSPEERTYKFVPRLSPSAFEKDGCTLKQNPCLSKRDITETELVSLLGTTRMYLAHASSCQWLIVYYLEDGVLKRQQFKGIEYDARTGIDLELSGDLFFQKCRSKLPASVPNRYRTTSISFWARAYKYCAGKTLPEIEQYFTEHMDQFIFHPVEDIYKNEKITRISVPDIIRYADNPNPKSFDKIRIEILLISMTREELISYFRENKKKLLRYAYDRIESSKNFQKFEIPVQFLKLYSVGIGSASNLIFDFELRSLE